MSRPRTWTDNQLRVAFTVHGLALPALCRALNLTNTAKNRRAVRNRLILLGIIG